MFQKEEYSIKRGVRGRRRRKPSRLSQPLRKIKVKSRKSFTMMAVWALITITFTIAWYATGITAWGLATLLSGLVTGISAIATFNPDVVVQGVQSPKPSTRGNSNPRGNGNRKKSTPPKAAQRKRVCSARCRASTKPITDCNCVCGGKTHGAKHRDP